MRPNFYRAIIDNDNWIKQIWQQAGIDSLSSKAVGFTSKKLPGSGVQIKATVASTPPKQAKLQYKLTYKLCWTIWAGGRIDCDVEFSREGELKDLPRVGFTFAAPDAT